eukprot:424047_1
MDTEALITLTRSLINHTITMLTKLVKINCLYLCILMNVTLEQISKEQNGYIYRSKRISSNMYPEEESWGDEKVQPPVYRGTKKKITSWHHIAIISVSTWFKSESKLDHDPPTKYIQNPV